MARTNHVFANGQRIEALEVDLLTERENSLHEGKLIHDFTSKAQHMHMVRSEPSLNSEWEQMPTHFSVGT